MANENVDNNEQNVDNYEQDGNASGGGKKTGLIIIILVVILIVAAVVVFFVLYPKYQELTGTADDTEQVQEEEKEKLPEIGMIYKINGLTVNPKNSMGRRFAVFDLALEYTDPVVNDKLNKFQPIILDRLLIYLRSKTIAEYSETDTVDKMREEMKTIINEVMQEEVIKNMYFTRFVLE